MLPSYHDVIVQPGGTWCIVNVPIKSYHLHPLYGKGCIVSRYARLQIFRAVVYMYIVLAFFILQCLVSVLVTRSDVLTCLCEVFDAVCVVFANNVNKLQDC